MRNKILLEKARRFVRWNWLAGQRKGDSSMRMRFNIYAQQKN